MGQGDELENMTEDERIRELKDLEDERNVENVRRKIVANGAVNFSMIRPTEMKYNTRSEAPTEATRNSEAAIVDQEEAVRRFVREYNSSNTLTSVLTEAENRGKASIKKRIDNGEILLTFTDKDSRVVICTPEQYITAAEVHLEKDEKVPWTVVKPTVTLMNRVSRTVTRVFRIGQGGTSGQRDRVNKASLIQDTSPPNVSFLWKTHKVYRDIPPTRPVCDATSGPISRTSNLLSTVLKPLLDQRDFVEGCDSTEDMLASVVQANEALDLNPAAKETTTI